MITPTSPEPELVAELVPGTYTVIFTIRNAPEVDSVDWYFGDGSSEEGTTDLQVQHDYSAPGTYTVTAVLHPSSSGGGGGGGTGPGPLVISDATSPVPPITLTISVHIPPIDPIKITGIDIEVVTPPPWWTPGGPDHYPEGTPLRFRCLWEDYVPNDDIAPANWRWWAIRVEDGQVMAYGQGEVWTCGGLPTGGSGCHSTVTPYRIKVAMYLTNGGILSYEKTIFIEPTHP